MEHSKLKDFEILSRLGAGSFGTVYKVRRFADNLIYVIKNVRIAELSYREQTEAINEVQILAQLKSPFVVRYFDSFIDKESLNIVMEFCNRGDLQNLLRKAKENNSPGLKEYNVWNINLQVILGLYYLHRKHILHRDLKSANVFLMKVDNNPNYQVKIGDLGVAKLMDTSTALASTIVGTPYYLSPELCKDLPYRDKSDCWALGILLYECCTLQRPFEARNQCALIMKIIEAPVKRPPEANASPELANLIIWLLQKDPNDRPSIKDILNELFVREMIKLHGLTLPEELLSAEVNNRLNYQYRPLNQSASDVSTSNKSNSTNDDQPVNVSGKEGVVSYQRNDEKANSEDVTSPTTNDMIDPSNKLNSKAMNIARNVVNKQQSQSHLESNPSGLRGDRVRGNTKRVPSEKALNRYQMKNNTAPADISRTAEAKIVNSHNLHQSMKDIDISDANNKNDAKGDSKDEVTINRQSSIHSPQDMKNEHDDENNSNYEEDFEEFDDEDIGPLTNVDQLAPGTSSTTMNASQQPFSAQSTGDLSQQLQETNPELWNSVWTQKRGAILSENKQATDALTSLLEEKPEAKLSQSVKNTKNNEGIAVVEENSEEIALEPLEDLIKEAKSRSVGALGDSLFRKVYTLCKKHMGNSLELDSPEPSAEDPGYQEYVQELEDILSAEPDAKFDAVCQAVFGVKVLLALETKHNYLINNVEASRTKK